MMSRAVAAALGLQLLTTGSVHAAIISVSGDLQVIPLPAVADVSQLRNDQAQLYAEHLGYTVPDFSLINPTIPPDTRLTADISTAGTYPGAPSVARSFNPGTSLDSYVLNFWTSESAGAASGTITFGSSIIGVMTFFGTLPRLEAAFEQGVPAISTIPFVGLELYPGETCTPGEPCVFDSFSISADLHTLGFAFNTSGSGDQIRIFTEPSPGAVPEPNPLFAASLSTAVAIWLRTRRKQRPCRAPGAASQRLQILQQVRLLVRRQRRPVLVPGIRVPRQ